MIFSNIKPCCWVWTVALCGVRMRTSSPRCSWRSLCSWFQDYNDICVQGTCCPWGDSNRGESGGISCQPLHLPHPKLWMVTLTFLSCTHPCGRTPPGRLLGPRIWSATLLPLPWKDLEASLWSLEVPVLDLSMESPCTVAGPTPVKRAEHGSWMLFWGRIFCVPRAWSGDCCQHRPESSGQFPDIPKKAPSPLRI